MTGARAPTNFIDATGCNCERFAGRRWRRWGLGLQGDSSPQNRIGGSWWLAPGPGHRRCEPGATQRNLDAASPSAEPVGLGVGLCFAALGISFIAY